LGVNKLIDRLAEQFISYNFFDYGAAFGDYSSDIKKFETVFQNPAVLKVFALQCDLFSLGKIYAYKDDVEVKDNPGVERLSNPNPMQSRSQFLWDYMFWNMLGTANCYVDSDIPTNADNKLYFLDLRKIEYPPDMVALMDKIILSKQAAESLMKRTITYRYADGSSIQIPLNRITTITDLTNGTGNWIKGKSRIDALYKVIANSDETLNSSNINIRMAGKYMVAGKQDPGDVTKLPMGEAEKDDIEKKMNGRKQVHAVKSMIDIKRFVEDMRALELGKQYLDAYFIIGNMYGIPRDVLEAYTSSTYENQEKARASHVSYTLQPKGNDLLEALSKRWGYDKEGISLVIDWEHLPFMQVFASERAKTNNQQVQSLTGLLKLGVSLDECNQFLDTNFKTGKYEQPTPKAANSGANQGNKS
jgi:hypothetical protein